MTDTSTTPRGSAACRTARPPDPADAPTNIHAARSTGAAPSDPFRIRDGIIGDAALSGLRSRKKGRSVGTYQARQNNVRGSILHEHLKTFTPLTATHSSFRRCSRRWRNSPRIRWRRMRPCNCAYALSSFAGCEI